jgi:hypothetical protein
MKGENTDDFDEVYYRVSYAYGRATLFFYDAENSDIGKRASKAKGYLEELFVEENGQHVLRTDTGLTNDEEDIAKLLYELCLSYSDSDDNSIANISPKETFDNQLELFKELIEKLDSISEEDENRDFIKLSVYKGILDSIGVNVADMCNQGVNVNDIEGIVSTIKEKVKPFEGGSNKKRIREIIESIQYSVSDEGVIATELDSFKES